MKYPCDVMRDLLPLYLDRVCSAESEKIVEEHLKECSECRAYKESIKEEELKNDRAVPVDMENESRKASCLRKIKKKILHKQILAAILAVVVLLSVGAAMIGGLKNTSRVVPYKNNLAVSMVDGSLMGRLYGSAYTNLKIKNITVDDGQIDSCYIFYQLSDTVWDDICTDTNMMTEYVICPEEKSADRVDRVYYYTGEFSDLEEMGETQLQMIIQNSILLWQKQK